MAQDESSVGAAGQGQEGAMGGTRSSAVPLPGGAGGQARIGGQAGGAGALGGTGGLTLYSSH